MLRLKITGPIVMSEWKNTERSNCSKITQKRKA